MEAIIIFVMAILLVIVFLAGPRVKIDTTIRHFELPEDLDEYLAREENAIPGIRPETEKKIFWAGKKGEKTELSLVYIHGYSATRKEASPVTERVAQALGANCFLTRLAGHGLDSEAMGFVSINDWCNDVWEACEIGRRIGNKVIMIGFSTGAPLVMWLIGRKPANIAAFIMMSPNFAPADKSAGLILWPWGPLLIKLFVGKYHRFAPINELHEKYWTPTHRSESLMPMMAACKLGRNTEPGEITIPVLAVYTEIDEVISVPRMLDVYNRLGSDKKKIVNIPNATNHILTGDAISPQTTEQVIGEVVSFIRENVVNE